jgi:flagellar protein FlbD
MIILTRLNHTEFAVNPDLIERVSASPDTTLIMVGGTRHIVTESLQEVIEKIARYRAYVLSIASDLPSVEDRHGAYPLTVVHTDEGQHGHHSPLHPEST